MLLLDSSVFVIAHYNELLDNSNTGLIPFLASADPLTGGVPGSRMMLGFLLDPESLGNYV